MKSRMNNQHYPIILKKCYANSFIYYIWIQSTPSLLTGSQLPLQDVYKLTHKTLSVHPHFAEAFIDEEQGSIVLNPYSELFNINPSREESKQYTKPMIINYYTSDVKNYLSALTSFILPIILFAFFSFSGNKVFPENLSSDFEIVTLTPKASAPFNFLDCFI